MKTAFAKIREFSTYTKGWDFGEGDSFSPKTIVQAFVINRSLINFRTPETDAFPCSEGKIAVTAYDGPWYWEFVIKKDGKIDHIVEKGDDIIEENKGLSFQEVLKLIKTCPIRRETPIWSRYESLIKRNTTPEKEDLEARLSRQQVTVQLMFPEYPLLTRSALKIHLTTSAPISQNFMQAPQEPPLSFGNSTHRSSPRSTV